MLATRMLRAAVRRSRAILRPSVGPRPFRPSTKMARASTRSLTMSSKARRMSPVSGSFVIKASELPRLSSFWSRGPTGMRFSAAAAAAAGSQTAKDLVQSAPVVIFDSPTCGFCAAAKRLLDSEGISYNAYGITYELRSELFEITGKTSVPSIWVGGKYIGGYSDGPEEWMGLKKLAANGQLFNMVDEAETSTD